MAGEPKHRGGVGGWVALAVLAVFGGLMKATAQLGGASIPIWFMTIGGAALILNGQLGRALARRIGGDQPTGPQLAEVPEELYAELDELRARVAELEERQDFSERLLARRDEPSSSD